MPTTNTRAADLGEVKTILATMEANLGHLAAKQDETIQLLRGLNGSVRSHGEALAGLTQWRTTHESNHNDLEGEVKQVRERVYAVGMVNGVLTIVAASLAALAGALGIRQP